jgi:hypothetical protein
MLVLVDGVLSIDEGKLREGGRPEFVRNIESGSTYDTEPNICYIEFNIYIKTFNDSPPFGHSQLGSSKIERKLE